MMSLAFGLFTQVSGSGPLGPLVLLDAENVLYMADLITCDGSSGHPVKWQREIQFKNGALANCSGHPVKWQREIQFKNGALANFMDLVPLTSKDVRQGNPHPGQQR